MELQRLRVLFAYGFVNGLGVAVDDSAAHPGRIYVSEYGGDRLQAFEPDGSPAWPEPIVPKTQPADVAVDSSGHPWLNYTFNPGVLSNTKTSAPRQRRRAARSIRTAVTSRSTRTATSTMTASSTPTWALLEHSPNRRLTQALSATSTWTSQALPGMPSPRIPAASTSTKPPAPWSASLRPRTCVGVGQGIAYDKRAHRGLRRQWQPQRRRGLRPRRTGTVPDPTIEAASEVGSRQGDLPRQGQPAERPQRLLLRIQAGHRQPNGAKRSRSHPPEL